MQHVSHLHAVLLVAKIRLHTCGEGVTRRTTTLLLLEETLLIHGRIESLVEALLGVPHLDNLRILVSITALGSGVEGELPLVIPNPLVESSRAEAVHSLVMLVRGRRHNGESTILIHASP